MQNKRNCGGYSTTEVVGFIVILTVLAVGFCQLGSMLKDDRVADMEHSAIDRLRNVISAEEIFRAHQKPPRYAAFEELAKENLIESNFIEDGYRLETVGTPGRDTYAFKAVILRPKEAPEMRSFYTDQTGFIRYEIGPGANAASPPISPDE